MAIKFARFTTSSRLNEYCEQFKPKCDITDGFRPSILIQTDYHLNQTDPDSAPPWQMKSFYFVSDVRRTTHLAEIRKQ